LRLETVAEQVQLIKVAGEHEEVEIGLGDVETRELDPVYLKVYEFNQQMINVALVCNKKKSLINE
jgi:hypothetical protein